MVNDVVVFKIVSVVKGPTVLELVIFVRLNKQPCLEQLVMLGKVLFFCSNLTVLKQVARSLVTCLRFMIMTK